MTGQKTMTEHERGPRQYTYGAVLVGATKTVLSAQRVARRRAQVGDLHDDAVAGVGERLARAVGLDRESPARAACWAGTGALTGRVLAEDTQEQGPFQTYRADTELVLGDGGVVAGLASGVEAASGGLDVAVAAAPGVG